MLKASILAEGVFEHYNYLLIRFNKTPEISRSASQVLSILLTPAATFAILGRANSKERVGQWLATCVRELKVPGSGQAVNYAQR